MRNALILFFSIVILICGCTKSDDGPSTPPVFQNASIEILSPADSSYFPKSAAVTISAKVTADGDDHSYLRAYVRDDAHLSGPVVANTNVTTQGDIIATLPSNLSAGSHRLQLIVVNPNDSQQVAGSVLFSLFIGTPPPVAITSLDKDGVANIINWSRSDISNFKAYEIYAIRTDLIPDRGPVPVGTLVGTVTNQDSLSYRHADIMFYYRYSYMVRVVTVEDFGTDSERQQVVSGSFMNLEEYNTTKPFYEPQSQKIYMTGIGGLMVLDPVQLAFIDSIPLPDGIKWMGMNDTRTRLNFCIENNVNRYQVGYMDVPSGQQTLYNEFSLPHGPATFGAVIDKTVIYASRITTTTPSTPITVAYNFETGVKTVLRLGNTGNMEVITGDRVVVTNNRDSIFIFSYNGAALALAKSLKITGADFYGEMVHESSSLIAIGTSLFDQSFNKVHEIDFGTGDTTNSFIGISSDGQYAVTRHNEVINTATKLVERRYGDVFGGLVYFSNDNNVLYHFTESGFNVRWRPGSRLHRYPWR